MIRTCLHPNCRTEMPRGRECCNRHYAQLTEEHRRELSRAQRSKSDPSLLGALRLEIEEWFHSRMIGPHEIVICRGRAPQYGNGCGADLVWLPTRAGKNMPVDAASVEPEDHQYEHGKHVPHWKTCPNAADFRKPAEER